MDWCAAQRHRRQSCRMAVGGGRHRICGHNVCDVQRGTTSRATTERSVRLRPQIPGLRATHPHPHPPAAHLQRGEIQMAESVEDS